jgi:hypothetical protein
MKKKFITILLINLANGSDLPRLKDQYQLGAFTDIDFSLKPCGGAMVGAEPGVSKKKPFSVAEFLGLKRQAWKKQLDETDFKVSCNSEQKPKFALMHALFLLKSGKKLISADIAQLLYEDESSQADNLSGQVQDTKLLKPVSPEAAYVSAHVFNHDLQSQFSLLQQSANSNLPEIKCCIDDEIISLQKQMLLERDMMLMAKGKSKIIGARANALSHFLETSVDNIEATLEAVKLIDEAKATQKLAIVERLGVNCKLLEGAEKQNCYKLVAEIVEAEEVSPEVVHACLKIILGNCSDNSRFLSAIALVDNCAQNKPDLKILDLLHKEDSLKHLPTLENEVAEKETLAQIISFHQAYKLNKLTECREIAAKIKELADHGGSRSACVIYGKLLLFMPKACEDLQGNDNLHLALYYLTQVSQDLPNLNSVIARVIVNPGLNTPENIQLAIAGLQKGVELGDTECKCAIIDLVVHREMPEFQEAFGQKVHGFIEEFKKSTLPEIKAKALLDSGQNYYIKYEKTGNKAFEKKFIEEWTESAKLANCNAINKLAGYYLAKNQLEKSLSFLTDDKLSKIKNIKILNNCQLIKYDALKGLNQEAEMDKLLCQALHENRNPYLFMAVIDRRLDQIKDTDSDYMERLDDCMHALIKAQAMPAEYKAQDYFAAEENLKLTFFNGIKKLVKRSLTDEELKQKVLYGIEQLQKLNLQPVHKAECQRWQNLLIRYIC